MSFKGVSSASSKRLSKTFSETGLNPIEPQHFCGVCTQSVWLVVESLLVQASEKESQLPPIPGYRANNNMAVTRLKQAGTTISRIQACKEWQLTTWFLPRGDIMSYLLLWACTFSPEGVPQSGCQMKWSCILFLVRYNIHIPLWMWSAANINEDIPPLSICSFSRCAFLPHSAHWKYCGFHTKSSSDSGEGLKVGISSDMYLFGIAVMIPTAIMKKLVTWKFPHCSLWQSILWHCC